MCGILGGRPWASSVTVSLHEGCQNAGYFAVHNLGYGSYVYSLLWCSANAWRCPLHCDSASSTSRCTIKQRPPWPPTGYTHTRWRQCTEPEQTRGRSQRSSACQDTSISKHAAIVVPDEHSIVSSPVGRQPQPARSGTASPSQLACAWNWFTHAACTSARYA